MPSDRARRSYDAARKYRSVVSQQGRVTVEADANEAEEIRSAQSRAEVIDIVGPTGTPDDGFKISVRGNAAFNLAIGQGCLYLGGLRVAVENDSATYLGQKNGEWVDYPAGAPSPYPTSKVAFTEVVYLAVTEQEVSAVEDPALREVALGGPDTSGRTRLIQRVLRAPTAEDDCEDALSALIQQTSPGLALDLETMRLTSSSRLKVDFVPPPDDADECQPTAQAGFLGAENQLIRVQVVDTNTLLWGYDNASFLYRATIDPAKPKTLALKEVPVDVFHRPRAAQWVEVLGTAVALGGDAYVANAVGVAREVAGYDPTENVITLQASLPAELLALLQSSDAPPQMFVRVWENRLPFSGDTTTATELIAPGAAGGLAASTGVRVYTAGNAVPGDFWMVGVRPSTPDTILPLRLLTFQPADGPGRWATPLAMITWDTTGEATSVHDCRRPFDNLVELTRQKCCELKILPGDDAQEMIDAALGSLSTGTLHVRFAAGVFTFDRPLEISRSKGGELTVSGCGTTLVAPTQEVALLMQGWETASVFDLSVVATVAQAPAKNEFPHLGGAMTFLDCRSVTIERVVAACGSGDRRAASCVTIRNADGRGGDARVRGCELLAGSRQVGVLLVNVDRATVEDNQIGWHRPEHARIPPDALKRALISDVNFDGRSRRQMADWERDQEYTLSGGDRLLYFRTHEDLAGLWSRTFEQLDTVISRDAGYGVTAWRALQRVISSVVTQIVHRHRSGRLDPSALEPFHEWVDRALLVEQTAGAAGQGIVVGGVQARDIRVLNNTIDDAMDGIHVGLSTRGAPGAQHLFADRVQVVGNTMSLRIPWYERRAHAGVFVGNATVATVRDNRVEFQQLRGEDKEDDTFKPSSNFEKKQRATWLTRGADGIRVWGMPGRMLLVTGNFTQNADIGIHVVQESGPAADSLFLLTQNIAVDANMAIEVSPDVTAAPDNVPAP